MIDSDKRSQKEQEKERTRRRMHAQVDRENYEYIPEKKRVDYYDNDTPMRVAIYVRVSTDDVRQTTSYELQKRYYEDFVPEGAAVPFCCSTLIASGRTVLPSRRLEARKPT